MNSISLIFKYIFFIFVFFVFNLAHAGWKYMIPDTDGDVYFDENSIVRTDQTLRVWLLYDFKELKIYKGMSFLSDMRLSEFDCKYKKYKIINAIVYSGNMGDGKIIHNTIGEKPVVMDLPPGSVGFGMASALCRLY